MTPSTLVRATQGLAIPGLTILQKIDDPLRLCTIYATEDGDLVVGFGGTKKHWLDWLLNLDPTLEAETLLKVVRHWIYVYHPGRITLAGHSQGGAHAVYIGERIVADVVTFGGLPTRSGSGTHYLHRADPMAWVPWWTFGLERFGTVVKIGKPGFSFKAHDPKTYLEEMEKQGYKK